LRNVAKGLGLGQIVWINYFPNQYRIKYIFFMKKGKGLDKEFEAFESRH
jgi:hypothetical protein